VTVIPPPPAALRDEERPLDPRRARIHEVIFEADTPAGRLFDTILIVAILTSVLVVLLESVPTIRARAGSLLLGLEWLFTIAFTIEYGLRLYSVQRPRRYATSFFGLVDLLAVIPTYLSLFVPGAQSLLVIRILRLLRVFRVFKLAAYLNESRELWAAVRGSSRKILVFLFVVVTIVVIVGTSMHVIEGPERGFTSVPLSIYWAVVTLTTVGYGDLVPATALGKFMSTLLMLTGYAIIAVPTGIVSAEMTRVARDRITTQACPRCGIDGHEFGARFCRKCGAEL
jgi:voltage-gated potassium channel